MLTNLSGKSSGKLTLMRLSMFLTILVTGLLVAAPAAHAVPFGTVTLTQNGANVDISVSLGDSNQFVLTSPDDQYFEFNGAPSLASITVDQTAAGVHLIADTGAFSGDGAGDFLFGITCDTGTLCGEGEANALAVGTSLSFHVANTAIAALTQPNNLGNFFFASILSPVPEPSTLLLLGGGLVGLFYSRASGRAARPVAISRQGLGRSG